MVKYQAIKFAGTWNTLGALTYKIDVAAPASGLAIVAKVVTSGSTPVTGALAGASSTWDATPLAANFASSSTPYAAGSSSTSAGGTMYGNALASQVQTTSPTYSTPGDIAQRTVTASWTES